MAGWSVRHEGLRRSFSGLGTTIDLRLWPVPRREAAAAAALAEEAAALRDAEARLSRFDPRSEISRLNRAAGAPLRVSSLTFGVIAAAMEAATATAGLFDPTIEAALRAAGYDRTFAEVSHGRGDAAGPAGGKLTGRFREVALDPRTRTVRLPDGVGLDLGGIAKGWLADAALRRLGRHGAAVVDLGGDIALSGPPPGRAAWEVAVADPRGEGVAGWFPVRRGGVATSGVTRRQWWTSAGRQHHLIDPRTGRPAETDLAAVTVVAATATAAEVGAKCVLLLGSAAGSRALADSPGLAGVLIPFEGPALAVGDIDWQPAIRGRAP